MTQWLEINIKINDFTYAVREEVNDINETKNIGIGITNRLHDIVNKREKKPGDKIINYYYRKKKSNIGKICRPRLGSSYSYNLEEEKFGNIIESASVDWKIIEEYEDDFEIETLAFGDIVRKIFIDKN